MSKPYDEMSDSEKRNWLQSKLSQLKDGLITNEEFTELCLNKSFGSKHSDIIKRQHGKKYGN